MVKRKVLIMHRIDEIKESLNTVYSKPKYIFLAALIAFLIFSLFLFLTNIPIFLQAWSVGGFALFPKVSLNIINTILSVSGRLALSLMIAIAIMGGINISMVIFKFRATRSMGLNFASIGGILGSAFGVGCPACSTSLISILGISGGLAVLPFKGVEITSLGLLILLVAFYFTAKSISLCEACKVGK